MNRWTFGHGLWTLTKAPPSLPGIRCFGTGETKKAAARAWVNAAVQLHEDIGRRLAA